jgi:ribonuclease III
MREALATLFLVSENAPHFDEALTHPSFANEQRALRDNQRLEFLGDAVLQLCVSEFLWHEYPDASEGELTRRRSQLVNTEALGDFARRIGMHQALRLGKGAEAHGLRDNTSVLADAVEALIAASYLDGGIDTARQACFALLREVQAKFDESPVRDTKSELQELVQARGLEAPQYQVLGSGGPSHEPWFQVAVTVGGQVLGEGRGRSKRHAEREAAHAVLLAPDTLSQLKPRGSSE